MKNILFIATLALMTLVSCHRETQPSIENDDGLTISVGFDQAGGKFDTRAIFDNVADAEAWEKQINNARVYVVDDQGKIIMMKNYTGTDIENLSTKFVLPLSAAGKECTFYAFANVDFLYTQGAESRLHSREYDLYSLDLNGKIEDVTKKCVRSMGFPMSASKKVIIKPKETPTQVSLALKRTVAKVVIKVDVDPGFSAKYDGGSMRITSFNLVRGLPLKTTMLPVVNAPEPDKFQGFGQSLNIKPGETAYGIFYIPDTPRMSEPLKISINAEFDNDGLGTTRDDVINFGWEVEIDGSGGGEIKRNGYYRIHAVIESIDVIRNAQSDIQASEWETPTTKPTEKLN